VLSVTADIPDLAVQNFARMTSSIRVHGGMVAAIYTQANYQGWCQTVVSDLNYYDFVHHDYQQPADNTITSVKVNATCKGPVSNFTGVELYEMPNYTSGYTKIVTSDIATLDGTGWNDRTESLQLHGIMAVAVYSAPNFGGTCETFVHDQPDLAGTNVGTRTISSIRIDSTCGGAVTGSRPPVVGNLLVVTGRSAGTSCPNNYTKKTQDLNEGASGDFIYLCVLYRPFTTSFPVVTDLNAKAYSGGYQVARNRDCTSQGKGWQLIDTDLNRGAGADTDFVYFCMRGVQVGNASQALADVDFVKSHSSGADPDTLCNETYSYSNYQVSADTQDLNSNVYGARWIYTCLMR